ncbi:uncharacterized protein [Lolium perenne]|uniref:uncharacterized protein n=1 Tax=Lolium perenne TaxID=4522 RepID=UPI003A9A2036
MEAPAGPASPPAGLNAQARPTCPALLLLIRRPARLSAQSANGHSGGLLLGFRDETFEVGEWRKGVFFISAKILQRNINMIWCFMLVYGPADHGRTDEFLGELERVVAECQVPLVIAGDFNLIRSAGDKSNDNINWPRVRRFNESIASMALREINRAGARFTWTNRQLNPIRGEETRCLPPRFFFQTWWFSVNGFGELVKSKLDHFLLELGPHRDCIDLWQCVARNLRQFLKGWGTNLGKEKWLFKDLLSQVEELDRRADVAGLDEEGWALRYHLEDQLILLDRIEEEYWKQRSRVRWTLEGDSCTKYFHAIANGRRRKCSIPRLITPQGEVDDQRDLMEHVYDFYRG